MDVDDRDEAIANADETGSTARLRVLGAWKDVPI